MPRTMAEQRTTDSSRAAHFGPIADSAHPHGDGLPCSACGEPVVTSEPLHTAVVRGLAYGFHARCYQRWIAGDRERGGVAESG
jgi:hypothetical protein